MRRILPIVLLLGVAAAAAQDLGNRAPPKVPGVYPVNIPNPERQGGDTLLDAVIIPTLPFADAGTTAGYTDDYASTCVFAGGAPDVVYQYTVAPGVEGLDISLCGSSYDSGLYVYDSSLNEIACNDDYCGLQSQLDNLRVTPGQTYYIVVDGYSSASGAYVIDAEAHVPCVVTCPDGGWPEGEPPLEDEYVDNWNGGCNTSPDYPFQHIRGGWGWDLPYGNAVLCGVSGWYLSAGLQYRDTDWFTLCKLYDNLPIEITADAEYATYIFELYPRDCANIAVAQQATAGPCGEAHLTIDGPAGLVWFWVGPTVYAAPGDDTSYDYVVWFSGLNPWLGPTCIPIVYEPTSWGAIKSLYR